jgi:riboflavin biosynthesis pyrimidine reductase
VGGYCARVPATFRVLLPRTEPHELGLDAFLERLRLEPARTERRPRVALNMISSADGRATMDGRSGPLGNRADRELFHALRTLPDAVMVGARTMRVERYNRMVAAEEDRARRVRGGLEAEPWSCIVSASLALDPAIPLLADADARLIVLTPSEGTLPPTAASVEYVRTAREGQLDLAAAMAALRERFGIRSVLCEGGPHLAGALFAAGLVDELFLTLAPKVVAGDIASTPAGTKAMPAEPPRGAALAMVSGAHLDPPVALRLHSLLECDSYLFLRYLTAPPHGAG